MVTSAFTPAIPTKSFLPSTRICTKLCSLQCSTCNVTSELTHADSAPHPTPARDCPSTTCRNGPPVIVSAVTAVAAAAAAFLAARPRACAAATNDQVLHPTTLSAQQHIVTCESHPHLLQPTSTSSTASHQVLLVRPPPVPPTQNDEIISTSSTTSSTPLGTSYDPVPSPTISSSTLPPITKSTNPRRAPSTPPSSNNSKSTASVSGITNFHASLPEWSPGSAPRRTPPTNFGGFGSSSASAVARAASTASRVPSSTTVGLVGVGALTSGSVLLQHARRRESGRSYSESSDYRDRLHNVCTVVCMQIPFCVRERAQLLKGLNNLVISQSCSDAAAIAQACCAAAKLLQGQAGVLEDSRCFAPHVDMFLAESIEEAERRFSAHVTIESARIDRVGQGDVGAVASDDGDYGVVTMVVATTGGVDLHCYENGMTNLQRLRSALDAIGRLGEGEVAGLELLWVPEKNGARGMSRAQMLDSFPSLRIA